MLNQLRQLSQLKDPLVKGHPLHAILTDVPVGVLVAGCAFDTMNAFTRDPSWRFAARAAHTTAFASGCLAALVGLWDYQAVPTDHPARRTGALHGYLNAAMLGMEFASVLLRRDSNAPASGGPNAASLVWSTAALMTLGASGWLGGNLVFHLGWRVVPAEHAEQLEDALRQRGETRLIDQAHETVQRYEEEHALLP